MEPEIQDLVQKVIADGPLGPGQKQGVEGKNAVLIYVDTVSEPQRSQTAI